MSMRVLAIIGLCIVLAVTPGAKADKVDELKTMSVDCLEEPAKCGENLITCIPSRVVSLDVNHVISECIPVLEL